MPPHRIAVLLLEPVVGFDAAIPPQLFGSARDEAGTALYEVLVVGLTGAPVRSESGYAMVPEYGASALATVDTVIVPGTRVPSARLDGVLTPDLAQALAGVRPGTRMVSICTGAFVLAAAGLLDGRRVTTHWMHAADLARRYPNVEVDPGVLYVDDGDILTSAGTAAGIDLCLHMVRLDYGADAANIVARRMVVPPHRDGGQAQYVNHPLPDLPAADPFSETLVWVQANLGQPLSVADLASRAAMSPRTFARRFRDTHGTTPHQWILRQRVLLAQRLLETTDLSIDLVADRCGFGTATNLRQHFQRTLQTAPSAYRRTFQRSA